jgi:hypothetical protein
MTPEEEVTFIEWRFWTGLTVIFVLGLVIGFILGVLV